MPSKLAVISGCQVQIQRGQICLRFGATVATGISRFFPWPLADVAPLKQWPKSSRSVCSLFHPLRSGESDEEEKGENVSFRILIPAAVQHWSGKGWEIRVVELCPAAIPSIEQIQIICSR